MNPTNARITPMINARNVPIAERPTPGPIYAKAGVACIENIPTTARQTAVKWPCFTIHLPSCVTVLSMRTQHAIYQVEWLRRYGAALCQ
jgi:hypothetical protein